MGSEGRNEQIIRTDQDNGLILRDGYPMDDVAAATAAFTAALVDFGYPPCPGGVMVSRNLLEVATARTIISERNLYATAARQEPLL